MKMMKIMSAFLLAALVLSALPMVLSASADYVPQSVEASATAAVYGDVDGDEDVTLADISIFGKILAKWIGFELPEDTSLLDLNADGKVNPLDLVYMARHVADWDDYKDLPVVNTDDDDIPENPIVVKGITVPMTDLDSANDYFTVYASTDVTEGTAHSFGDAVGEYSFDPLEQSLHIKRSDVNNNGYYRYFIKAKDTTVFSDTPWVVVTYRTNADTSARMYLLNNKTGGQIELESDITVSGGEYVYTTPVDMSAGSSGMFTRFVSERNHIMLGVSLPGTTSDDVYMYIKEISFFETEEDACNYINNTQTPEVENYTFFPLYDLDTAKKNLMIYKTDDVPGGTTHSFGENAGRYAFDSTQNALLIKKSTSNYMGGYYRFHIKPKAANMVGENESWMVVSYRTNASDKVGIQLGNNSVGNDNVMLETDITVSGDKWVYSTPVNIDTNVAEQDLFYRVRNSVHNALVVKLPEDTSDDVYFYLRGIYFFSSEEAAKRYIATAPDIEETEPDIGETEPDIDPGLPEAQWVDPSVISFESALATNANATVTEGSVNYTADGAYIGNSVVLNYNSQGLVADELTFVSLSYVDDGAGSFTLTDGTSTVKLTADTSVSDGEWTYTAAVKMPTSMLNNIQDGESITLSYSGTGTPRIGKLAFVSAVAQADDYFGDSSDEEITNVKPVIWKYGSSAIMAGSGAAIYQHADPATESGTWEQVANFEGKPAIHLMRGTDHGYGNFRFMPKKAGGSTFTENHRYMRVTYYVSGLDYDGDAFFRFFNNGGAAAYATMPDDLAANEGKWTVSQVIDLLENVNTAKDPTDNNYSLVNRIKAGGHFSFGLINAPDGAQVYISEIAFFGTIEDAYEHYGDAPASYIKDYLDAELGAFTDFTVLDGEGFGEWTYDLDTAFTLTDSGNSNLGGNYKMAFKFNIDHFVGNKYMRVVYKADNGSATDKVKLTVVNPKYGNEVAILESNVVDTNDEWVLSGVAELPKNICDRLGGTGEYNTGDYEKMYQQHVFMGFDNTASDAEYGVRDIYFFKTLEDALALTMPAESPKAVSTIRVGTTVYADPTLVEVNVTEDTDLEAGTYRIYAQDGQIYANYASDADIGFVQEVVEDRVLGGDMYLDVINITVASDFVLTGTIPSGDPASTVALKYDDRYTFDKAVAYVDSTSITSTDAVTGEADKSVLRRIDGETFTASGIGEATVYFTDGSSVKVTVTAAPLNVIMLIGQSNAEGVSGSSAQSIRNTPGQVYSTYACAGFRYINMVLGTGFKKGLDALTIYNNDVFVPVALTSDISRTGNELTYNLDELSEGGFGKGGIDSAIAYEWNKQTGEKVWVINVAHSGSGIGSWNPGSGETDNNFWQAVGVMKSAEETLTAEIAAGHYTLSHMGYYWLQGCSDHATAASVYTNGYKAMHDGFIRELAFDHDGNAATPDKTIEFGAIILVRSSKVNNGPEDFYMNGPRISQYYLGNSAEGSLADVYLASNVGDIFKNDTAVANYFKAQYGTDANFMADNNVTYKMPTTVNGVHPDVHYRQSGYNEVGRDAARNMIYQLGLKTPDVTEDVTITILDEFGVELDTSKGITLARGASVTMVPVVAPRYAAGDVSFEIDGNISVSNHYVFTSTNGGAATVTFVCGDVEMVVSIN